MNELRVVDQDKVVNVRQAQLKKEQLLNRIQIKKGHKLYEYNIETNEMQEAKIEATAVIENGVTKKHQKVIANKHCLYVSALNKKNAVKKLIKRYTK